LLQRHIPLNFSLLPAASTASSLQNGLTISGHINRMGLLTLPDLFRRKYGALMEVIVSLIEIASFTCLLAGNLVGTSLLLQFLFGLQLWMGLLIAGIMMASYTIAGGLFSIAYVDIPQVSRCWQCVAWVACCRSQQVLNNLTTCISSCKHSPSMANMMFTFYAACL
jgi:Na+(H+)/acetate symporter ActP